MIFNNNSTRGHTGSLLVFTITMTISNWWYIVSGYGLPWMIWLVWICPGWILVLTALRWSTVWSVQDFNPLEDRRIPRISDRDDDYRAHPQQMVMSPLRHDPFAGRYLEGCSTIYPWCYLHDCWWYHHLMYPAIVVTLLSQLDAGFLS